MVLGSRIADSDWITKVHIRLVGPSTYDACYETLGRIDPYLESEEWQLVTTGYYLNIIEKSAGPALRISFFASTKQESLRAKSLIDMQCKKLCATLLLYEPPNQGFFSQSYGGAEYHFRSYLVTYSQIVIEIIRDKGVEYTRRLFALFRFRIVIAKLSSHSFLEPVFRNTPTYTSLNETQRDQFWKAVDFKQPDSTPWVHMMVNLGIGADWSYHYDQVWTPERINAQLKKDGLGYMIPNDWQP